MSPGTERREEDCFSLRQAAKLLELPEARLRYWAQTGFVLPSLRKGERSFYGFRDLLALRVARDLISAGLPLRKVRQNLDSLKQRLKIDAPLSRLRIRCENERLVVLEQDHSFEAGTGQLLLDFSVADMQMQAAEILQLPVADNGLAGEPQTSYEWFLRACELEQAGAEDRSSAKAAYERALDIDPEMAPAWTNLGSLLAESGDLEAARDAFDRALQSDPEQPEAQLNLAELALRSGDADLAISGYRQVLRQVPDSARAHYGLARALLQVGGRVQALAHLERFLSAAERSLPEEREDLQALVEGVREAVESLRRELSR